MNPLPVVKDQFEENDIKTLSLDEMDHVSGGIPQCKPNQTLHLRHGADGWHWECR